MRASRVSHRLGQLATSESPLKRSFRPSISNICVFCQHHSPRIQCLPPQPPFQSVRYASTRTPLDQQDSFNANPSIDLTNHYTIFPQTLPQGPPPAGPFDISVPSLRREFLRLQSTVHPDKYPSGPLKSRAQALSARLNGAYRTLSDPLLRAQYLLHTFHNIDVLAENNSSHGPQDPETLMEVMEAQEALEAAEEESELEGMREENKQRITRTVEALGECLEKGDVEGARKEAVRLRFWRSLDEGLREWEKGKEVRLVH